MLASSKYTKISKDIYILLHSLDNLVRKWREKTELPERDDIRNNSIEEFNFVGAQGLPLCPYKDKQLDSYPWTKPAMGDV